MKAGILLGQRLRDDAVSFPRAVESWSEVRAVKKRWALGGDAPCASISDPSVYSRLVSSHALGIFLRALSLHECNKTYVTLEKVIYIQKYKFVGLSRQYSLKTQITFPGAALSLSGFSRITGCPHGKGAS